MKIKQELVRNETSTFTKEMDAFLLEAEPLVDRLKRAARDIQDDLRDLLLYYGEDPNKIKSEIFFDIIATFSSSFEVKKNYERRLCNTKQVFRRHKVRYMKLKKRIRMHK